eukprot:m.58557 g.58557  ORF g.58557 m.58557 type:complete len:215 (+) comp12192_c0_seq1:3-647(+)
MTSILSPVRSLGFIFPQRAMDQPPSSIAPPAPAMDSAASLAQLQASVAQLQETQNTQPQKALQTVAEQFTAMKATVTQLHSAVQAVAQQQTDFQTTLTQLDARFTRHWNLMAQKIHNQDLRANNRLLETTLQASTWQPIVREDGTPRAEWKTAPDFPASSLGLMTLAGPQLEALLTFYGEHTPGMTEAAMMSRLLEICTGRLVAVPERVPASPE